MALKYANWKQHKNFWYKKYVRNGFLLSTKNKVAFRKACNQLLLLLFSSSHQESPVFQSFQQNTFPFRKPDLKMSSFSSSNQMDSSSLPSYSPFKTKETTNAGTNHQYRSNNGTTGGILMFFFEISWNSHRKQTATIAQHSILYTTIPTRNTPLFLCYNFGELLTKSWFSRDPS